MPTGLAEPLPTSRLKLRFLLACITVLLVAGAVFGMASSHPADVKRHLDVQLGFVRAGFTCCVARVCDMRQRERSSW